MIFYAVPNYLDDDDVIKPDDDDARSEGGVKKALSPAPDGDIERAPLAPSLEFRGRGFPKARLVVMSLDLVVTSPDSRVVT